MIYEIRVRGLLDEKWAGFFAPFVMSPGIDETILVGPAQDQAQLFGMLVKISNLGLTLVSVNALPVSPSPATT